MSTILTRRSFPRLSFISVVLTVALALFGAVGPTHAGEAINTPWGEVAIGGADPVAYFTMGERLRGSEEFTYDWLGATWRFTSAEHRNLFAADPIKYAPQYGGYCANGVSDGSVGGTTPLAWRIVDGGLYLFASDYRASEWEQDSATYIAEANAHWKEYEASLTQ